MHKCVCASKGHASTDKIFLLIIDALRLLQRPFGDTNATSLSRECSGYLHSTEVIYEYHGTCNELVDELVPCTSSAGVIELVLLLIRC